jgi:hypothetical protein
MLIRMMTSAATAGLFLFTCYSAAASEWTLFGLRDASVQYKHFTSPGRDPLFLQNSPPARELNLNLNLTLLRYGFINNTVHSMMDENQFRIIGWKYQLGVQLSQSLSVQYEHFSRHHLDREYKFDRFPVEDSLGITLRLYGNQQPREGVLPW